MHSVDEEGNTRNRYYEGVRFIFTTSPSSRVGVLDLITLLSHVAIMIVYFNLAKTAVMLLALY